jgi:hypothetical protein
LNIRSRLTNYLKEKPVSPPVSINNRLTKQMISDQFIGSFLASANAFDTNTFIKHWHKDAVLDDPSVGRKFNGHDEIREYFEDYFIGYQTQTKLTKTVAKGEQEIYIEVLFSGSFPGGKIRGSFDLLLKGDKIFKAKADLIH